VCVIGSEQDDGEKKKKKIHGKKKIKHTAVPTSSSLQLAYLCVSLCALGALQTVVMINYLGMFNEVFATDKARAAAVGGKQLFSILGMLVGMSVPPVVSADWAHPRLVGWTLAPAALAVMGIVLMVVRPAAASSPRAAAGRADKTQVSFAASVRHVVRSAPFRIVLAATAITQLGNGLLAASFQAFTKQVTRVEEPYELAVGPVQHTLPVGTQIALILTSFYVVGIAASPVWGSLSRTLGPRRAWGAECIVYAALLSYFLIDGRGFAFSLGGASLLGFAMGGFMSLPDVVLSSIAAAEGRGGEGMFLGVRAVVVKGASAAQGLITGAVLAAAGPRGGPGETAALTTLTVIAPMALFALGGVVILAMDLTHAEVASSAATRDTGGDPDEDRPNMPRVTTRAAARRRK
jgi:Na+/melibiose symporter-like transporter